MTPVTGNAERVPLAEFFGYPPVSRDTVRLVAPLSKITPVPVDSVDRTPRQLAQDARQFLDGA